MNRTRILVAERIEFSPKAAEMLRELGDVQLMDLERESLLAAVRDVDILWVRLRNQIDAEVMDAAPQLKVIVSHSTGLTHIDLQEAEKRSIRIISLLGEADFLKEIRATAELTVALLLAAARHVPAAITHVEGGQWNRDLFKGHELYGKTAGVVGYGRLGRIVARYLHAFDMRVLATDPFVYTDDIEPHVQLVSMDDLLRESDVVSLHASYSSRLLGFFGKEQFAAMKPGAWFVNTARGELVDETALLAALESGHISAAALDVLANERSEGMDDHPLVAYARSHDNLIITPHIGGCTTESMEKTEVFLAGKLRLLLEPSAVGTCADF